MSISDDTPREVLPAHSFRTLQPADVEPPMAGEAALVQPVRMTKKGVGYGVDMDFDFRPRPVEGADPKDSAVPEPVPSSTSETTDGTSENQEPNASVEKGSQTETKQPKSPEGSTPEPTSPKKTSGGKSAQPAEL